MILVSVCFAESCLAVKTMGGLSAADFAFAAIGAPMATAADFADVFADGAFAPIGAGGALDFPVTAEAYESALDLPLDLACR